MRKLKFEFPTSNARFLSFFFLKFPFRTRKKIISRSNNNNKKKGEKFLSCSAPFNSDKQRFNLSADLFISCLPFLSLSFIRGWIRARLGLARGVPIRNETERNDSVSSWVDQASNCLVAPNRPELGTMGGCTVRHMPPSPLLCTHDNAPPAIPRWFLTTG